MMMESVKVILVIGILLLAGCSEKGQLISGKSQAISKKSDPIIEETFSENQVVNESQYGDLPNYNPEKKIQLHMPTSVTLEYPYKGPSLSIYNSGKDTFMIDPEYRIEKQTSGVWREVTLPDSIIFEGESSYLEPGKAYHQKIEFFLDTKTVEEGTYRVIKFLHPKEGGGDSIILADEYQVSTVEKYSETGYIIDVTVDRIWLINDPQVEIEGRTRDELRKEYRLKGVYYDIKSISLSIKKKLKIGQKVKVYSDGKLKASIPGQNEAALLFILEEK